MFWIVLLVILLGILFLPIPLKLTLTLKDNCFELKIYNKLIYTNKKVKTKENKTKSNKDYFNPTKQISYKALINYLQRNIFKPWIKLNFDFEYSLDDASFTAITYGLLYNFNPILYCLIKKFFSLRSYSFSLIPQFKNVLYLNLKINSIIFFNIFQVILILYYTKKSYFDNKKEGTSL